MLKQEKWSLSTLKPKEIEVKFGVSLEDAAEQLGWAAVGSLTLTPTFKRSCEIGRYLVTEKLEEKHKKEGR